MASPPDISVVIPTGERFEVLVGTLDALAKQDPAGVEAEVVVVDNGSRDGSLERLHDLAGRWAGPFPLAVSSEEKPGAAAARNAGVARARGNRVLFLGDDCRPAGPDLVAGHARAGAPGVAVLGRIDWDPQIEATPVRRWL